MRDVNRDIIAVVVVVAVIIAAAVLLAPIIKNAFFSEEEIEPIEYGAVGTARDKIAPATSTLAYLKDGVATTTWVIALDGATSVDLNFFYTASGTASQLVWYYEFSTATNTRAVDTGVDAGGDHWYPEDVKSVSGLTVTHGAGLTLHKYNPEDVASTTYKNVSVDPVASKYMRLNLHSWGEPGAWWGEAILNKPY